MNEKDTYIIYNASCLNCGAEWCFNRGKLGIACTGYIPIGTIFYSDQSKIEKVEEYKYCPYCGKKLK